jgi:hypothetical protein
MSQVALAALYLAIGIGCAVVHLQRARAVTAQVVGAALLTIALWPLWAPFSLSFLGSTRGPVASRVAALLDEASALGANGLRAAVLRPREAALILAQVEASEQRLAELDARLQSPAATSELRAADRAELAQLRDREQRALAELSELCEALRDKFVISRHAGLEQVEQLRDDLRLRIAALSELP